MSPCVLEALFLTEHFVYVSVILVLWSQWAIVELDLPTALSCLAFGLSNIDLMLLDISTCVELWSAFLGESKLIFMLWVTKALPH
jgi:hypothetical protein